MVLLLQKSIKSLQLVLNEFCIKLDCDTTVTSSAYTQARQKLCHTAFIELNEGVLSQYYALSENYERLWGFRVFGVDGSKIRLPDSEEIKEHFGTFHIANQTQGLDTEYASALTSVCYDLLNNIAISSEISHGKSYEVELAKKHFPLLSSNDLVVFDRHYASLYMIANLTKAGINFIIRCPKSSFVVANRMFEGGPWSREVVLETKQSALKKQLEEEGLPFKIRVRFVRVKLATGESEVLVTSLLDTHKYKRTEFKYAYGLRWGIETFYGTIKGRLNVDHFTGKSVESIKQDFYSTIFLSNIETIFTKDAQEILEEKAQDSIHGKAVNKAVSFNAIKNYAFEIFYESGALAEKMEKLTQLFLMNPITVRKNRKVPRRPHSDARSLYYQKQVKKAVF